MWINPIDKLPQVPQDWANHIIYGGSAVLLILVGMSPMWATIILLLAGLIKKTVDYFFEHESLSMCVGKTLVGGIWGATIWLLQISNQLKI